MVIPGIERTTGLGGLPKVTLSHPAGPCAEIYLFGATLTSYKSAEGNEVLFVSKDAIFNGQKALSDWQPSTVYVKAIRGGIPIVFPVFGQDPKKTMAQHGFARNSEWLLADQVSNDEIVKAVFHLSDSDATRSLWPHAFLLSYTLSLTAKALTTSLRIDNVGTSPFDAQALLHTYYHVNDINKVAIHGFQGKRYVDKVHSHPEPPVDERAEATIAEENDRIYETGANEVALLESGKETARVEYTACRIHRDGSDDALHCQCVLWNPWINKAKGMADFGDDEYKGVVCIEPGIVSEFHPVSPGDSLVLEQTIRPSSS